MKKTMSKMSIAAMTMAILIGAGCGNDLPSPNPPGCVTNCPQDSVSDFENIPALEEMVVYEINERAFSKAGNFAGITANLDHIQSLGVNVIWLMPIHPIGKEKGINSPYSVQDYKKINPEYGSSKSLISLINEAHERDMAVILDWVANHTAWDHPWIASNPEWYTQDSNGNIVSPSSNDFVWNDVADLNFDNNDMRAAMIEAMSYWVEKFGIDGFRCDAVDFVPTDFWSQAISTVNSKTEKNLIWLAEGGIPANLSSGFEMDYAWDFYAATRDVFNSGLSASRIKTTHETEYEKIPGGDQKLRYITNHDIYAHNSTPIEDFSLNGSVSAFVITAFMGGVPLIYNGQEVGTPRAIDFFNSNPIDWSINPEILSSYQNIMSTRSQMTAVHGGYLESYTDNDVVAFKRYNSFEEVLVLVNVRRENMMFEVPVDLHGVWLNTLLGEDYSIGSVLSLAPNEYFILQR